MVGTSDPLTPVYLPPRARRGSGTHVDRELERVKKLAGVLDRRFVDPILGLILPGAGDVIGSLLGLYTVSIAVRRRVSPVIVARMLLNLGIDSLIGIVPLVGDLFDIGFKAHQRNAALLVERTEHGGKARPRDWAIVAGALVLFATAIGFAVYAIVSLVRALV